MNGPPRSSGSSGAAGSLVEELQRTLVAHALDAPEPATSIDAILEQTVGAELTHDGSGVGARARRWLRWTNGRVLTIAAAAAVVLVAVGVVDLGRALSTNSDRRGYASSAGPGYASSAGAGASSRQTGNSASGLAGAEAGVGANGPSVDSAPAGCASDPAPLAVPSSAGHQLSVITTRCWLRNGEQAPSTVIVVDRANPGRPSQVLISPTQDAHVDEVYLDGSQIIVRAARWNDGAPSRGAIYEYPFQVSADGTTLTALPPRLYAIPCTLRDLSLGAVPVNAERFTVRIVNSSSARCAVEGYPQLSFAAGNEDLAGGSQLPNVASVNSGERAGPIVLDPRGAATAQVDLVTACELGSGVVVSLPAVGLIGVTTTSRMCARVTVHPFVPGK